MSRPKSPPYTVRPTTPLPPRNGDDPPPDQPRDEDDLPPDDTPPGGGPRLWPWLLGAGLLLGGLFGLWLSPRLPRAAPPAPPLEIGVVAEPRIGGTDSIAANTTTLAGALSAMRGRPGTVSPRIVVLSGEIFAAAPAGATPPAPAPDTAAGAAQVDTGTAATDSAAAAQDTTAETTAPASNPVAPPTTTTGGTTNTTAPVPPYSLAAALAASPVSDVYVVPASTADRPRIEAVRRRLAPGVRVVDLTLCYETTGTDGCWADVAGTPYRLVGVLTVPDSAKAAPAVMQKVEALLSLARAADRKVVLVAGRLPATLRHGRPAARAAGDTQPAQTDTAAENDTTKAASTAAAPAQGDTTPREWADLPVYHPVADDR